MKVAITHPYSWPEVRRGAERIVVETARALTRRGHEVTLITAGSDAGRTRDPSGYEVVRFRRLWRDSQAHERWFALRLLPELTRSRFDVVHSMMPRDALAAIRTRSRAGHRVVYEELGNPVRSWWVGLPDERARLDVVAGADAYGCMSRYALAVLRRDHGRQGVLVPGGVALDEFAPAESREATPTILFSGAIHEPRKGVALLLDAVARLGDGEVAVWLSGPGDAAPLLASAPPEAAAVTQVLPLGEPHEQAARYGRAWVTALPSKGDSFGMVLLESLACGTPIVTIDDSAAPELVAAGTGAVAKADDPDALADALRTALELAADPATTRRCRAAASGFGWDELAVRLEAIYKGAVTTEPDEAAERRDAVVDRLLADPPLVHNMSFDENPDVGVWSTDESCYRFLAAVSRPGMPTLETGSGLSTALFALVGTNHTCVTPGAVEVERLRAYCRDRDISLDTIAFEVERSEIALPRLSGGHPLDLVLIDGSHGHPMPTIDWFYGASRLRRGGILVVDDVHLCGVRRLVDVLDADPRWAILRRSEKWAAYERQSEGSLSEDWFQQPFLRERSGRELLDEVVHRGAERLRYEVRRRLPARPAG